MALFSYPVCTWLCQYVNMGVRKWLEKSAEKQKYKLRKTLNPLSRKAFQAVSFSATKDKKEASAKQVPLFSTNRGGGARGRATFPRREGGSEGSGVSSRLPTLLYIAPRAFAALCLECYGYITRTQNHLQNKNRFDKMRTEQMRRCPRLPDTDTGSASHGMCAV